MQVGIASLYVASKCEEYFPADLKKLVHLTENSYEVQDVFDMELVLLGVIHFQVIASRRVFFCIGSLQILQGPPSYLGVRANAG